MAIAPEALQLLLREYNIMCKLIILWKWNLKSEAEDEAKYVTAARVLQEIQNAVSFQFEARTIDDVLQDEIPTLLDEYRILANSLRHIHALMDDQS